MKAVVLTQINGPLEVREITLGELHAGQVLVKNLTSGLCGAQLQEINGNKGNSGHVPHLLGHEGCGIVESVGPGVSTVKPGDKVIMHWRVGSGIEGGFPEYFDNGIKLSGGKVTTLSEFSIVSENRVTKVPISTDVDIAAMLGCSLSTALGIVENEIDFKLGQRVLIVGMGGVGQNLLLGMHLIGCPDPHVLDKSPAKEAQALELGAGRFATAMDVLADEYDIILDTTGNASVFDWSTSKLSSSGLLVLIGQPNPSVPFAISAPYKLFQGNGKTIKTTQGGKFNPELDIPRYLSFLSQINFRASEVISDRLKLEDINKAVDMLKDGAAGKIIFEIGKE